MRCAATPVARRRLPPGEENLYGEVSWLDPLKRSDLFSLELNVWAIDLLTPLNSTLDRNRGPA